MGVLALEAVHGANAHKTRQLNPQAHNFMRIMSALGQKLTSQCAIELVRLVPL